MAVGNLGELFVKLGFQVDNKPLESINSSIKSLRTNIATIGVAFTGATFALNKFLSGTIQTNSVYSQFNQKTGLSIDMLQKFESAALKTSETLTSGEIIGSIENLSQKIAEIKMGRGDLTPFNQLNVSPFQDTFDVLESIRKSIQNIDDARATNILQKLGLTNNFLPALRTSREEFEKLSHGIFLTAQQRDSITRLNLAMRNTTTVMKQLKDQAVAKLAPELTKLTNNFFKWMLTNSDKIISAITSITDVFVKFIRAVGNSFSIISEFINKLTGTEKGIKILSMGITLLMLSFRPLLAVMVGIIALLDDIKVWKEGGESLFGGLYDVLSKMPSLITVFGGLALIPFLKKISGLVGGIAMSIGKIGGLKKLGLAVGAGILGDKLKSSENRSSQIAGSAIEGAMIGSTIGSMIPVVGTAVGGGIGAVGGIGYNMYKKHQQDKVTNNNINNNYSTPTDSKNIHNIFNISIESKEENGTVMANDFIDQIKRIDYKLSY